MTSGLETLPFLELLQDKLFSERETRTVPPGWETSSEHLIKVQRNQTAGICTGIPDSNCVEGFVLPWPNTDKLCNVIPCGFEFMSSSSL